MTRTFSIAAAALVLSFAGAAASDLPAFEKAGYPITTHQVQVVGTAQVAERSPVATPDAVTPHQRAVLRARHD